MNDYTLSSIASYAVNNGLNTNAPAEDIVKTTRPIGPKVDIGAYESSFTCGVSTAASGVFIWTGSLNNDWFECSNWNQGAIPSANIDVEIPVTANNPRISGTTPANVKTIEIQPNAELNIDVTNNGKLNIAN